jgi:hypothetical protein
VRAPRNLLSTVQQKVTAARSAHAAELVGLVMTLLDAVPPAFQELIGSVLSQLPISLCNSICTNVHGPSTPLYMMGHKMLASYPYVPIGGEMGMNCAVLSYNGVLCVGFTGDALCIPDIHHLPSFFRESFDELKKAAGVVRKERPVRVKKKRRSAKAKSRAEAIPAEQATTIPAAQAEAMPLPQAEVMRAIEAPKEQPSIAEMEAAVVAHKQQAERTRKPRLAKGKPEDILTSAIEAPEAPTRQAEVAAMVA